MRPMIKAPRDNRPMVKNQDAEIAALDKRVSKAEAEAARLRNVVRVLVEEIEHLLDYPQGDLEELIRRVGWLREVYRKSKIEALAAAEEVGK